jgi:hypothetical protein
MLCFEKIFSGCGDDEDAVFRGGFAETFAAKRLPIPRFSLWDSENTRVFFSLFGKPNATEFIAAEYASIISGGEFFHLRGRFQGGDRLRHYHQTKD